jgi:FAD/FMN-containing dehydrogenase/Fe-S oxidoreductase
MRENMIPKTSVEASQDFIQELRKVVAEAHFDRMTRLLYSTDASIYQMMPIGVAIPGNAAEASAAVELAGKHQVPVLARGGGSSLAGQAVGHALILDFSKYMDSILEIDPDAKHAVIQPGITHGKLNRSLKEHGLMFGPDPASGDRATMGGIMGNNSTGAHSIVYGMSVDHILETEVVLADGSLTRFGPLNPAGWEGRSNRSGIEGSIYRGLPGILDRYENFISNNYPNTFRHVAGYNLNKFTDPETFNVSKIIVGSEGTLGVITQMKLNLVPIPKYKRLAMVHFSALRAAMESVPVLLESGPTAIEVLDKMMLDLTRDRIEYRRLLTFVEGDPEIILMVEFSGESEGELDAGIKRLQAHLNRLNHRDPVVILSTAEEQTNVWFVRKVGLGILMSIRGDAKPIPFIEDAAVPVEYLADYVSQIYEYAYQVGVEKVAMYAHASAGCIHIRPLVNLKTKDGVRHLRQIAEKSVELVVAYGGTTSGEHGEGLVRGEFSGELFGPELQQAFVEVKQLFDPTNLLNPGKVVGTPKMDDESLLRFGSDYNLPLDISRTALSFENDGGFARAVEMCNGAGVCRKLEEGVMCPSFQALRDEAHSTRGRANALRSAMMGQLGPGGLYDEDLYQVLDLCLSCHACKAECPSAVDLAKLKAEFLHQYHQKHGVPLRSQLFANIANWNQLGSGVQGLSNLILRGPARWALQTIGVHPARSFPTLAKVPFSTWFLEESRSNGNQTRGQVVFFHDTFVEHNDPQIGKAAIKLLLAAGYEPIMLQNKACCGRPAMSKGLLDKARELALHNLALLAPYAERGTPIVGCEPSCMAMLVDEYRDLIPGPDSEVVSKQATLIDAFLAEAFESVAVEELFDGNPRQVLYHGHCQQKAVFGTESTHKILGKVPNLTLIEIDSGCCGMAGSFGYEKEHYELSIQLAEMALAPAVREASPDTIICASGTSCREQIFHTTGRKAVHPVEVVAAALIA